MWQSSHHGVDNQWYVFLLESVVTLDPQRRNSEWVARCASFKWENVPCDAVTKPQGGPATRQDLHDMDNFLSHNLLAFCAERNVTFLSDQQRRGFCVGHGMDWSVPATCAMQRCLDELMPPCRNLWATRFFTVTEVTGTVAQNTLIKKGKWPPSFVVKSRRHPFHNWVIVFIFRLSPLPWPSIGSRTISGCTEGLKRCILSTIQTFLWMLHAVCRNIDLWSSPLLRLPLTWSPTEDGPKDHIRLMTRSSCKELKSQQDNPACV